MKHVLRQMAITLGFFGALYALALAITFVVQPDPPRDGWIDGWAAGDTLYVTAPKYEFLGRDVLDVPDRKVLLMGASNTALGFKLPQLGPLVSCAKTSNLALGNANITEVRQMADLVHDVQHEAARRTNTFVIGVWFGMFVDTALRWPGNDRQHGDTDLDIERYRYGFYRHSPEGPVAVLPPSWLHVGVVLIRPYLLLDKVARDATLGLRHALFVRQPELTDDDRERIVMTGAEKSAALAYWRQTMGGAAAISQDQVALLDDTIDGLLRSGEKVVLVDLPIPAWHRDASPYEPEYRAAIQRVFDRFADQPGFAALRMPDLDRDTDYSDEVHAKPHLARVWATRLADVLNPLVCGAHTASGSSADLGSANRGRATTVSAHSSN